MKTSLLFAAVVVLFLICTPIHAQSACPSGTSLQYNQVGNLTFALSNGYVCLNFNIQSPSVTWLSGSFEGTGVYGVNTLGPNSGNGGIVLERQDGSGTLYTSATTGGKNCPPHVTSVKSGNAITVVVEGISEDCVNPTVSVTWKFVLEADSRYVDFYTTGNTIRSSQSVSIRTGLYLNATSIYGLYDRGVMQMKGLTRSQAYYGSYDTLSRFYALGGNGDDLSSRGDVSITVLRSNVAGGYQHNQTTVLLSSDVGAPYWSGFQESVAGTIRGVDQWGSGWGNTPAITIPSGTSWGTFWSLAPNSYDFPIMALPRNANTDDVIGAPTLDIQTILTGIYASPVGNLFTHDNAVATGYRVAQIATTIHRPDVGYSGTYNYFDPDNYLSTFALLSSGDSYIHDQVRHVLERSGAYINDKGQLPHHFVGVVPTYQALSGATQTGPNVFWILSCFNYVKHSGNYKWLSSYMPTLRNASAFLFDMIDPSVNLLNAPGSLYIDVFIRNNFTSDSNAMLVGFFQDFAAAERALGNTTGAAKLESLATAIAAAVNSHLWSNDHYITQRNPDGTIRDFVDYDSNFIALANGIPTNQSMVQKVFSRLDGGRCTHGRATFVSEVYYGPNDCTNGNIGDSWCSMGRNGWFDALSRQRYGDQQTFDNLILNPLQEDVRRWTWLHERYACDGTPQRNRTWAYFEYPAVAAIMTSYIRYGLQFGIQSFAIRPFGPKAFSIHIGETSVTYNSTYVKFKLASHLDMDRSDTRTVTLHGMVPNSSFTVHVSTVGGKSKSFCVGIPDQTVTSDSQGIIGGFMATIRNAADQCVTSVILKK
eukprot:PhF_6_TR12594/c0_g1_i1/m.19846